MKQLVVILISCLVIIVSCKKETFNTSGSARLTISVDTLFFDTVFTSVGSVTHLFRIYNDNSQKLKLSAIQISGGAASNFKINVDGFPGPEVRDVDIEPHDSLYVFVSVKIDPGIDDLPFVVQDSIKIEFNGNTKWVQLEAWGQNANFLRSKVVSGSEVWINNRPYVILGSLLVDTNAVLTIEKGCRIYLHADAPIIVDGTLIINGEKFDSTRVSFQSDRLDEPYRDFPASWPGIYFREQSKDNMMQFAVVKNAYQGIVADKPSVNANPKVTMSECIVDNCYDAGIFGLRSSIKAVNCLISNCGRSIVLAYGGVYDFNHCTDVAVSNSFFLHKDPVLVLTNFIREDGNLLTADLSATFKNSIFWGENSSVENEVVVLKEGISIFNVSFENCLWKNKDNPSNVVSTNILNNQNPLFDSVNTQKRYFNFRLKSGSPAINQGTPTGIVIDLDGMPRVGIPDIGCYEKQ